MAVGESLTCETFPAYLERLFPDYLVEIWKVLGSNERVTVTASDLVCEVFVDCIYLEAVKEGHDTLLGPWFETVERVLGGPDEVLRGFFEMHVVSIVLKTDRRARWAQRLAGPLLGARLDVLVGVGWRDQVGGFGLEWYEDLPVEVLVASYLYRGEILLHCQRRSWDRESLPTTGPFARVPVRDGAYAVGVTVARLLEHLSTTVDKEPWHHVDEFMSFAGVTDWVPFYAETLTVSLEGTADSFALRVWPIHKAGWVPAEALPVSDWRDAAELGAAVLAAFRIATLDH